MHDDPLDNIFHGHALIAFVETAREQQNWPDMEAVKQKAYKYYDNYLTTKGE
jgi:regulator of sigma D